MKFSLARFLVVALAAETAVASSWFTRAPYNKWHETELERWLSDHEIPYPTPADRKDLQNLVKDNWQSAIESPYANWDTDRLQKYLSDQGTEVKKGTEKNKDALVDQVKSSWHDADVQAHSSYDDVKTWIFNSWTESSLKSFCDRHGIPVPQPRKRDQALQAAREGYQTIADKVGQTAAYPGNWLYESWSDSDLKAWLDERGIPVPQNGKRDQLVASVRRNAYNARQYGAELASSASSGATRAASSVSSGATRAASSVSSGANWAGPSISSAANQAGSSISSAANWAGSSVSSAANWAGSSASSAASGAASAINEKIFDTWSDSQLKEWADKNGIKVPQGSNRNELLALARKNIAKLTGDNVSGSAASAYGAATSSAGNQFAKATDDAALKASGLGDSIFGAVNSYYREFKILVGLETNYVSSASATASSVYAKASKAVKGEL